MRDSRSIWFIKSPLVYLAGFLAFVLMLPGCTPATQTLTPTLTATHTSTYIPLPTPTAWRTPTPIAKLTPTQTTSPNIEGYIGDYRPDWIGFIGSRTGSFTVVVPDNLGDTTIKSQSYIDVATYKRGEQVVFSQSDATGHFNTWVFRPGTQNEFNAVLAQWKQTLKDAYLAGPCIIQVQSHDATVVFVGPKAHEWCSTLEGTKEDSWQPIPSEPLNMASVCEANLVGAVARVRDTGGQMWGSDVCQQLRRIGQNTLTTDWDTAQSTLKGIEDQAKSLTDSISRLRQITQQLQAELPTAESTISSEQEALKTMQAHLEHEKRDAGIRPMTINQACGTVYNDYAGTLYNDYNGTLYNRRINFQRTVQDVEQALSDGSKTVDNIKKAANDLQNRLSASQYIPPPISAKPGDEQEAVATFGQAVDVNQKKLGELKAVDAGLLDQAKSIMTEGKSILDEAKALAKCS